MSIKKSTSVDMPSIQITKPKKKMSVILFDDHHLFAMYFLLFLFDRNKYQTLRLIDRN